MKQNLTNQTNIKDTKLAPKQIINESNEEKIAIGSEHIYLDGDSASQSVEIFEQDPDADLVPGISVLLAEDVISGERVEDGGSAM